LNKIGDFSEQGNLLVLRQSGAISE